MSTETLQLVLAELRHQERRSREPWEFRSALEDAIDFVRRALNRAPGADLVRAEHVSGVRVEAGPSSPVVSPGPRAVESRFSDEAVARAFHEAYERYAPGFGYSTRRESAVPWDEVPPNNRSLMLTTVREVRRLLHGGEADPVALEFDALIGAVLDARYQWIRAGDALDIGLRVAAYLAERGAATITAAGKPIDVYRSLGRMRDVAHARGLLTDERGDDPSLAMPAVPPGPAPDQDLSPAASPALTTARARLLAAADQVVERHRVTTLGMPQPVQRLARALADVRDELQRSGGGADVVSSPAKVKIDRVMEEPTAPDWGGEETDEGTPIYSMAWDSEDVREPGLSDVRMWVGPYSGGLDDGWAVTVSAPEVDVVLRCTADQLIEWADCVRSAIVNSRRDAGRAVDTEAEASRSGS